jgi:hypothetical protein
MSAFDTARDLRLPGVVIENVYLDTKLLTTRTKNAVKKMLRSGHAHGSWSSNSKALAMKLAEGNDVMVVGSTNWGFLIPNRPTYGDKQVKEMIELIDAAEALELLSDAQNYADSYLDRVQARTRQRHEHHREMVRHQTRHRFFGYSANKILMDQMVEVFTSNRSSQQIEAAEKLCDRIDAGERITIRISY